MSDDDKQSVMEVTNGAIRTIGEIVIAFRAGNRRHAVIMEVLKHQLSCTKQPTAAAQAASDAADIIYPLKPEAL